MLPDAVLRTVPTKYLVAVLASVLTKAAEEAVPENVVAVIVPAEKLPEPSLNTKVETVFALVPFEYTVKSVPSPAAPPTVKPFPATATEAA